MRDCLVQLLRQEMNSKLKQSLCFQGRPVLAVLWAQNSGKEAETGIWLVGRWVPQRGDS